jgi:hypothetical protein
MLDLALIEKYISDTFLNNSDNNKYKQETFNIINRFFNMTDVAYDDLTRQDMLDIYSQLAIMKMNVFQSHKSKISDFMKWMYETGNGSIKPLEEIREIFFENVDRTAFYDTYYFENLADLNGLMEDVFGKDVCDFSTFRCAALLVWHGIPVKHLPDILKSDFKDDGTITDPFTGEIFHISPMVIPYLRNYRDADTFDSGKFGGMTVPYKQTQYLFRTYKSAHMTDKQLINTSSNAIKAAAETGRIFQWERIYDSGLYYRVHEYEKLHGNVSRNDYELLRELFKMDHIDLTKQRQRYYLSQKFDEYQEFKRYKYSD